MAKYKQKPVQHLKPGAGTAAPGPASAGSLLGPSNAPTPPTPWPLVGQRPYGGPQQVKGQPEFEPEFEAKGT